VQDSVPVVAVSEYKKRGGMNEGFTLLTFRRKK